MYQFDNPDLPTLQPWMNTTKPPADRFVVVRNPYFHRVDANGRQLPYIDRVVMVGRRRQADPGQGRRRRIRPAGARPPVQQLHLPQEGREDQQLPHAALAHRARLAFRAVPEPERQRPGVARARCATCASGARCRWRSTARRSTRCSISASAPRATTRCCRRARCIKQGVPDALGASTTRRRRTSCSTRWACKRGADGIRRLPDGRPLEIIVETAGEIDRADRRARADPRDLARSRHQAVPQALAARSVAQPRLLGRRADVGAGPGSTTACRPRT